VSMRTAIVGIILLAFAPVARAEDKLTLTVKETAGIRRFGYPVYVKLALAARGDGEGQIPPTGGWEAG